MGKSNFLSALILKAAFDTVMYKITENKIFNLDGKHYLFLVNSSALFEIENQTRQLLDKISQDEDGFSTTCNYFETELSSLENIGAVRRINPSQSVSTKTVIPTEPLSSLICILSGDCNLRCSYCYADHGTYKHGKTLAKEETVLKGIDFLFKESVGRDMALTFFGGEPLLNFPVLKTAIKYAKSKATRMKRKIGFSMTTNATLLNEDIISFLLDEGVAITVSIDGTRNMHDHGRKFPGGGGSYDTVMEKLEKLFKRSGGKAINARVTVVHGQANIIEAFSHLSSVGFKNIGFSPVSSTDPIYALTDDDLDAFTDGFAKLACKFLSSASEDRLLGFSNLTHLVQLLHDGINRQYPCGGGLGLMGMDTDGRLYVCHRFIRNRKFLIGDISRGIDKAFQKDLLNTLNIENKSLCRACWAKYLCGGGCYYEIDLKGGGLTNPPVEYCKWLLKWFTLGMEVYIRIMRDNPNFIRKLDNSINC